MLLQIVSKRLPLALVSSLLLGMVSVANADYALNMTQGVTPISNEVYGLHMTVFWICVVIGIGVFGVMAYSIFTHRKSKGAEAANFHESTTVEVVWTVIPLLILIGIAVPATSTLLDLENAEEGAEINIQVTGLQWKWRYKYLDEDVEFVSNLAQSSRDTVKDPTGNENYLLEVDKPLVVPVNKKIRFLFHSDDVIHSWWVPDLAIKKDAIPGIINETWFRALETGTFRGQCAELCGKDHGYMPIVVEVVEEDAFQAWLDTQSEGSAQLAQAEN